MICFQTVFDCFFFVVVTLIKRPAAFITHTFHFAGVERYMIGSATGFADASAGYPANKLSIGNYDIDYACHLYAQVFHDAVKCNCLFFSSREAVKDKSVCTFRFG